MGELTQTLVAVDQREVALAGEDDAIVAVRVQSGDIYVPLRPVCERLGIDVQAQTRRIRRDEVLAEGLRMVQLETKGGTQTLLCLELEGVPLWLAGVEPSRVRPALRDRLKTFKRWVRRRVYEAFVLETGLGDLPGDAAAMTVADDDASPLAQIESFGLALAAFARQQRAFEARYTADQSVVHTRLDHLDRRLDRAAEAFGSLVRDVQIRLDGSDVITDAQQSDIKALVQAIGQEMQCRGAPNPYQSIWTSLYKHFRVPTYSRLKIAQYPVVVQWLESYPGGARGTETTDATGDARADAPPSEP